MDLIDWLGYMSADIEVIPKLRRIVAEKTRKGECLKCDKAATRRGLCDHHYYRYRMDKKDQPKSRRAAFEVQAIRSGELLPDRQGQRIPAPVDLPSSIAAQGAIA